MSLVSIAEYLDTSYRPDCDYVDGRLVDRNVGERDHSTAMGEVLYYLGTRRRELGIHVYPSQRVQVSPTRFRVSDVCVVAGEEPADQIFHHAPLLCIEILSPNDRRNDMQERINDYLNFGVNFVWVINPQTRQAWIHTTEGAHEVKDPAYTKSVPRSPTKRSLPVLVVLCVLCASARKFFLVTPRTAAQAMDSAASATPRLSP